MPNSSVHDNPAPEPSRASSGLAKVLGGLRIRNQSNNSILSGSGTLEYNRPATRPDYFPEPAPREEYVYLEKLRKEKPLESRIQAAEALTLLVKDLPPDFVNNVWYNAQDMVKDSTPIEGRKAALRLFTACMRCFTDTSALDRLRYYRIITKYGKSADFDEQLHAMLVLTDGGRNLASFEKEISKTLIGWLKVMYSEAAKARTAARRRDETRDRPPIEDYEDAEFQLRELFRFITDVIKFNFQTFEEEEIAGLLKHVLIICRKTGSRKDVESVITFIQTLVTYGSIPVDSLRDTVQVLCGCFAAVPALADLAWTVIANLSRSHMGHQCVANLFKTLRYQKIRETALLEEKKQKERAAETETGNQEGPPETAGQSAVPEKMGQTSPKESKEEPHPNTLRGAVMILEKLVEFNGSSGLPKIELPVLFSAFQDALRADSPRLELYIMSAIAKILAMPEISSQIFYDEWKIPLDILVSAAKRTIETADGTPLERLGVKDVQPGVDRKLGMAISEKLLEIIQQLETACVKSEFTYVEGAVEFFLQCFGHLPDSAAKFVIDYYRSEHLCYPSCSEWIENSKRLVDIFFCTRVRPTEMRISVIMLLRDVYETIRDVCDEESIHQPILAALESFQLETDPKVLQELVKFIEDIASSSSLEMFHQMIDMLIDYCRLDVPDKKPSSDGLVISMPRPVSGAYSQHGSLVNIVVRGLVGMFTRNLEFSCEKSVRLYEALVRIASSSVCEVDARLTAMRLLFRLRTDCEKHVFVVQNPECDYLAGVLLRTEADEPPHDEKRPQPLLTSRSAATSPIREDDASSSSRSNRSLSASHLGIGIRANTSDRFKQGIIPRRLWTYPEVDPLPGDVSEHPSPVLSTYYDPQADSPPQQGPADDPTKCARVSLWLECVTPIIQQGANWEIYSYVLCHFPSQLSNKSAFRNCKEHIRMLRNIVCEQLHTNRIPSTDLPSDIKKADIAVALIHCLTVLTTFRGYFAKSETEGIVKAFQLGLHSWNRTAKPCIHALSVCCYELPMSTGKFLSGILTKLSQIITLPVVSVHILEFLSALAKLPSLYSNFVEADFRNIFGIAFRYIQHARETASQQSYRSNYPGRSVEEDKSDQPDLPQYVLTLAYNVLTTWFLSLRLSERPKYVSWIIRGLILHDGSNQVDEQSEACIDMLQRFTYSDYENKLPAKLDSVPGIVTKHWLHGTSILSVQMSLETGISRLTIRKPAGTSYFTLKADAGDLKTMLELEHVEVEDQLESNEIITQPKVLPSHILLQLFGGLGLLDYQKPILLPEDDKTRRALGSLDRTPVVDFHTIGVVYVGAGQTSEQEILANAMGSPDYTDFICGLGDLVKLKGADINTGGLDHENDIDGEFTYFWKDRMTEIIFHVITMMPNHEHDPQFTMKKRHIGNDYVNIVFNNSGLPWEFGTIPSQFNYVSIIISPEAKTSFVSSRLHTRGPDDTVFYRVKVSCKEGFTDISPAQEPKMVSAKSLPSFVRNIALNASVYSHVYREGGHEHVSSVRHRLRGIRQLRDRLVAPNPFSNPTSPGSGPGGPAGPGTASATQTPRGSIAHALGQHPPPPMIHRQSVMGEGNRRISTISTMTKASNEDMARNGDMAELETEDLLAAFDFSRYT